MEQKETIVDRIRKRRLTWLGHVTRMENGRLPIMALHSQVDGRRYRGRPTKHGWIILWKTLKHRVWLFEKRRIKPGRDQLVDFLLGSHCRRTPDGEENWNWKLSQEFCPLSECLFPYRYPSFNFSVKFGIHVSCNNIP